MYINKCITNVNRTRGRNGNHIRFIVIHYTGNQTDTAHGNANYFKSINRNSSAHYFVDSDEIYQCVENTDTAWAVGRNYGRGNLFGTVTNANSISIELCSEDGEITDTTMKNGAWLVRSLMDLYGIPLSRVVRHYDVCSKRCPGWDGWLPDDEHLWEKFKQLCSNSGWIKDDVGWWYKNSDGSYPTSKWVLLDSWYYFDERGYAVVGWLNDKDHWYYLGSDCRMVTGWKEIDKKWYYFKPNNGEMVIGWIKSNGNWYYMGDDGTMVTGFFDDGKYRYYAIQSGTVISGWREINSKWYYFNKSLDCQPECSMLRNHWVGEYYLKDDGTMACNETISIGGIVYTFTDKGLAVEQTTK